MSLVLPQKVLITLHNLTVPYYESLGYEIPRQKIKWVKKPRVVYGTQIYVDVNDLLPQSNYDVDTICDGCLKLIKMPYCNYKKIAHEDGATYCRQCAMKLFNSGELNPNFKPNKTDEERMETRNYPEYHMFVHIVLDRDNYKCRFCGSEEDILVHHMNGYGWDKENRTNPDNGITLCSKCHSNFHGVYGFADCTKEQFDEWLTDNGVNIEEFYSYTNEYMHTLSPAKKVYVYELNQVFDSATECAKAIQSTPTKVYDMCNGNSLSVKGYHIFWEKDYLNNKENLTSIVFEKNLHVSTRKPIINISDGKFYYSPTEAQSAVNIERHSISKMCNENKNGWMWYDDFLELPLDTQLNILKLTNNETLINYSVFYFSKNYKEA